LDLKDALTDGGFRVLGPVGSVRDALELLEEERPDAAVLDVTLGGEKVTPVALLLKSLGVPFVLASASDAAQLARHAVLHGVANLGKPTDMKRLVHTMRALHP
jgi:DNA-binding response OmpR family regulator